MKIEDVKRKPRAEQRVPINIKVKKSVSDWMKKHEVSPTKVFDNAIVELMKEK